MRTRLAAGAVLAVGAIFLWFAGDALAAYFTPDDMMNLYGAWFLPLALQARPLGALVYRAMFGIFGLNPLPYRALCFLLLAGNLALLYAVAVRLSGSRIVGAFACLLGAYHAHLADLYYSTGTVYDLLCFAFYWSAFLAWMRGSRWIALVLYAGALLSKEMAVTLPLVLAAYELTAGRRAELLKLAPMAALTGLFVVRALSSNGRIDVYTPHLAWGPLIENWNHYATDLFYGALPNATAAVLLLWAAIAVAVAITRTRDAWVAAVVIWAGLLPVAFIAQRGFYVVYLTLPGWYILTARLLERATRRVNPAIVFAVLALVLIPLHATQKEPGRSWVPEAHAAVRTVLEPLRSQALPKAARVLFVDDPYPDHDFLLTFIFRLRYLDDGVRVDRLKDGIARAPAYDRVYRITGADPAKWRLQIGE